MHLASKNDSNSALKSTGYPIDARSCANHRWLVETALRSSLIVLSSVALATQPVDAQLAPLANPNPNNYDNAKIMQVIRRPPNGVVVLSAHRGTHALAGSDQAPRVPENSLQAVGRAATAGWESIEIDVKLTADGVPILSHDSTWGREWCGRTFLSGTPWNPLKDSPSDSRNPVVANTSFSNTRSYFGHTILRDSIRAVSDPNTVYGCYGPNNEISSEYAPTLQEMYDYIKRYHIQMVVALDIKDAATAKEAWKVVLKNSDDRGRSATEWTLFKVPAVAFPNTNTYLDTFGADYARVKFNPVFHTSGVAQQANAQNAEEGGTFQPAAYSFGGEQNMRQWIDTFSNYSTPARIDIVAIEVSMKEPASVSQGGILSSVRDYVVAQGRTISQFHSVPEYYPNNDPALGRYFRSNNGVCCYDQIEYLYNNKNKQGPTGIPYDHDDQRTDITFLVGENRAQLITTDRPDAVAQYLTGIGKRQTGLYRADSNTPAIVQSTDGTAPPRGADQLPPATPGQTGIRRPDPSAILVNGRYYSVDVSEATSSAPAGIFVRSASTLLGLAAATPIRVFSDTRGLGEVWAPEIQFIDDLFVIYFTMGTGANHRMYAIWSPNGEAEFSEPQKLALADDRWAIDGMSFVEGSQRYFVWSGWDGTTDGQQNLYISKMSDAITPTGPRTVISQPTSPWESLNGGPYINEGPEAIRDPNGQVHITYSTNHSWQDQYCLADLRLKSGGNPINALDWTKSPGCLFSSLTATAMNGVKPTQYSQGPGHHSFALTNGDIAFSPKSGANFIYHAVPNGLSYSWANRVQYVGAYTWWSDIPYIGANGTAGDNGYSLGFYEDANSSAPPRPANPGPPSGSGNLPPSSIPGATSISNADPSVIRVGSSTYYSVEVENNQIFARTSSSPGGLSSAAKTLLFNPSQQEVWAPEIRRNGNGFIIYYAAGAGSAHRMYYLLIDKLDGTGSGFGGKLNLPDDKFAIDGTYFVFNNQGYFVWSGWAGDTNVEQNLYIVKMINPTTPTGSRQIVSQPREPWELRVAGPAINEAPTALIDPNGQLHIDYSANGSWSDQYCIADLRLRKGGDPLSTWDWFKSNGCLFGSNQASMMADWASTAYVNGPGSHSFVLLDGDIATSPLAGKPVPLMYHAVPKGTPYSWSARRWYNGSFEWYNANSLYTRKFPVESPKDAGWSLKFFEDPNWGTASAASPPAPPAASPGTTRIVRADPSVIRVGASTYYSVESDGGAIYLRTASSPEGLAGASPFKIWTDTAKLGEVWAPEIQLINGVYYVYFSAGSGTAHRMYYLTSSAPRSSWSGSQKLGLPGDGWAVDGTTLIYKGLRYFVWSGWLSSNGEQSLLLAPMSSPTAIQVGASATIVSQPREVWELSVASPAVNEAPAPLLDPNGQLHITFSANGSWSDQYCVGDVRLKVGGDILNTNDWFKSKGCLFGSNYGNMATGWDQTLYGNGPGSHSFVLLDGSISTSPDASKPVPLAYHAVPKGTQYSWQNRQWYIGAFRWWDSKNEYGYPGHTDSGWSLKFFEDPALGR